MSTRPTRHLTRMWPEDVEPQPDLPGWAIALICGVTAFLFIVVMPWIAGMWVR